MRRTPRHVTRRITRHAVLGILAIAAYGALSGPAAAAQSLSFERIESPNVSEFTNRLQGVYAAGENDVWTIGSSGGNDEQALIEHWDGAAVSVVPSPDQPGRNTELVDIDGTGPDDIWAVGTSSEFANGTRTLIEHWNGSEWGIVPSPNLGFDADHTTLTGVTAIAEDDAWAVGTFRTADYPYTHQPVVLHWDGTAWTSVSTDCEPGLNAVSALSSDDIWAVGDAFACHFDGTAWTPTRAAPDPSPNRPVTLLDVASVAAKDAWAVGYVSIPCGENVCSAGEIQRWDGARWTRVTTVADNWVYAVHVVGPDEAWAVASGGVLHYDGTGWTEVADTRQSLTDVTSTASGSLWAVGSTSYTGSPSTTVVLRSPPTS